MKLAKLELSGFKSFADDVTLTFEEGVTAEGYMEEKLFPFAQSFDISDLEPGLYVLTASTDDPSGGAEGFGPDTDSKVITIE